MDFSSIANISTTVLNALSTVKNGLEGVSGIVSAVKDFGTSKSSQSSSASVGGDFVSTSYDLAMAGGAGSLYNVSPSVVYSAPWSAGKIVAVAGGVAGGLLLLYKLLFKSRW